LFIVNPTVQKQTFLLWVFKTIYKLFYIGLGMIVTIGNFEFNVLIIIPQLI